MKHVNPFRLSVQNGQSNIYLVRVSSTIQKIHAVHPCSQNGGCNIIQSDRVVLREQAVENPYFYYILQEVSGLPP